MHERTRTEIVPEGPDVDRVALYLDDELVGFASSAAAGRATLHALVREIEEGRAAAASRQRRYPSRWPRRRPTWKPRQVGAEVEE